MSQLIVGHATMRLPDIDPAKHPGFSPNLYAYLKKYGHFYRDGGILDCAYVAVKDTRLGEYVGAGTLMMGYLCDGDFIGTRLMSTLCNGAAAERFCYPGAVATIVDGFWDRYLKIGRCAIDPEHVEHFIGDRFDVRGEERVCRWCSARQRRVVTPRTVIDESWVAA